MLRHEKLEVWAFLHAGAARRQDAGQWVVAVDLARIEEAMADVAGYWTRTGPCWITTRACKAAG